MYAPEAEMARSPHQRPPGRMEPLATLPLFFPLAGRRVVVIGSSGAAIWKAELLSAAGAAVEVWDADPAAEMKALAADPPRGPISIQHRAWDWQSLVGAALIVATGEDEAEAARLYAAASAAGVPVNVIDKPRFCTFQFGSIVNRSPLVVGVSTDGAAPAFGQAIRSRIEAMLPVGFSRWAATAKAWRSELAGFDLGAAARRRFWQAFAALALRAPDRAPQSADYQHLLRAARGEANADQQGQVTLVGAGPGDPELLTLKAVRALRSADVILFDDLVATEILDFARREAKRMLVGKTGYRPSCKQDDINALMIALAKSGKRVVRLKAGDPLIFGRGGEEIAALDTAGITCDVIPGISAAQGAAASLRSSLTHRNDARRLQFVTAHAHGGRLPDDLNFAALADRHATTAVYMPLGTLPELVRRLREGGAEPDRPVCAIFNATRPDEHIVFGTLGDIHALVRAVAVSGPCVLLVGSVARAREISNSKSDAAGQPSCNG